MIAKRYTKALVNALNEKEIATAIKVLESISKSFADSAFLNIINSPFIPKARKCELLIETFKIKDKTLKNFIKALSEKNRLCEIPRIYDELNRHIRAKNNEFELIVQSNFALDSKSLSEIKQKLEQKFGVSLVATHKKSNVDGIKIFIDELGVEGAFLKQSLTNGIKSHILKAFN
ncbi:F0F1 ATP synthase subunit delta [Helicobacter sp. 23-1044]